MPEVLFFMFEEDGRPPSGGVRGDGVSNNKVRCGGMSNSLVRGGGVSNCGVRGGGVSNTAQQWGLLACLLGGPGVRFNIEGDSRKKNGMGS